MSEKGLRAFLQIWAGSAAKSENIYRNRITCRPNVGLRQGGPPFTTLALVLTYIIVHYTHDFTEKYRAVLEPNF